MVWKLKLSVAIGILTILIRTANADYYDGLRAFEGMDYAVALSEWGRAANEGDARSQYHLGKLYEEGLGVPQNFVEAHRWYNLAAAQGDAEARTARDAIAEKMTAEELAEARKLATGWKPVAAEEPAADSAVEAADGSVGAAAVEGDSTGLIAAVRDGDIAEVERLLASGVEPNATGADGNPALVYALMADQAEAARRLVDAGADVNALASNGWSALMIAAYRGNADLVRLLVEHGASTNYVAGDGLSASLLAEASGSEDAVVLLRPKEAATVPEPVEEPEAAEERVAPEQLLMAAGAGDLGEVNRLLSAGIDPNVKDADGWTPLIFASIEGHQSIVWRLLDAKADPNAMGTDGATALMAAALKGHAEIVKALIAAGADIKQTNPDGLNALTIAEQGENTEIIALLGANGGRSSYPKELVRQVQELLTRQGIDVGGIDGLFGPATEKGIKEFQRRAGSAQDGLIDDKLIASLMTGVSAKSVDSTVATGSDYFNRLKSRLDALTSRISSSGDANDYYDRATVLMYLGEYERALTDINTVIKRDPMSPSGYNLKAWVNYLRWFATGKNNKYLLDVALQNNRNALSIENRVPNYHDTLAHILAALKDPSASLVAYKTAIAYARQENTVLTNYIIRLKKSLTSQRIFRGVIDLDEDSDLINALEECIAIRCNAWKDKKYDFTASP
ncbi:MAG: ankyrin repeat domain-containing protein [Alphaproteobacteria bacterium]